MKTRRVNSLSLTLALFFSLVSSSMASNELPSGDAGLKDWVKRYLAGQVLVRRAIFFGGLDSDRLNPAEFEKACLIRAEGIEEKRICTLAHRYPAFKNEEYPGLIYFGAKSQHHTQAGVLRWFGYELLAEAMLGNANMNTGVKINFPKEIKPLVEKLGLEEALTSETMQDWLSLSDWNPIAAAETVEGDGQIQLSELTSVLALVASSFHQAKTSFVTSWKDCHVPRSLKLDRECFFTELEQDPDSHLRSMPALVRALHVMPEGASPYWILMGKITRVPFDQPNAGLISVWELTRLYLGAHVLEALVDRFDLDKSGHFSPAEVHVFYGVFSSKIKEHTDIKKDAWVEAAITYSLYYGELPVKKIPQLVKLFMWKLHRKKWCFEAGRLRVLHVIVNIFH